MYKIYQIGMGDTLESVSDKFNTSIDKIKTLNGIKSDVILQPGGFIIVPTNQSNDYYGFYIIKKGDTIYDIANKNKIDYKMLLELNGLEEKDYIYPDQEILIPREDVKIYMTNEGDSINSLEEKLNIKISDIKTPSENIYLEKNQIILYK